MSEDKIKLRSVKVEYIKGKYAFKQRINGLDPNTYQVNLGSTVDSIKEISEMYDLYKKERKAGRLDNDSRVAIKGLQMNLNNPSVIKAKGITHIIVYEVLNP